jgi:fibronectin-binding autotransporter adhesin
VQLFSSLSKRLTGQSQTRRTPTPRFRPRLEALDDRLVPSTLTVTNNLDTGVAGDGSLRGAIAAARSGDTIIFNPSLSGQTIDLYSFPAGEFAIDGEMVLNKNLAIQGPSASLSHVTINGDGLSRIFEVSGAKTVVSLSNLNLTNGTGNAYALSAGAPNGQGGAIWNGGTLTINACNLLNNSAISSSLGLGGAIYNAGTLTVSHSTLDNNSVYYSDWFGTSFGDGGAIYNAGALTISNSTLDDNIASYTGQGGYGGAIFNAYRATATITGCTLSGNFGAVGGGIYNDGVMTLSGSTIVLSGGDGIYNDKKGHLAITAKCIVESDSSYSALYNLGVVKISADSVVG